VSSDLALTSPWPRAHRPRLRCRPVPRPNPTQITTAALAVLALAAAGCGSSSSSSSGAPATSTQATPATAAKPAPEISPAGDIPDNQAYVRYAPPGAGFSVKVPEGWSRTRTGGAVVFTDKLNSIRMENGAPAQQAGSSSTVKRTAGSAQKLSYTMKSAPDPVTGKSVTDAVERYVFTKGPNIAVLTLSGPKGADNVDPWRIVTDSLRWTR
jgi:hypothetical protein